jgi:Uncharacterised protein family (UPF0172)
MVWDSVTWWGPTFTSTARAVVKVLTVRKQTSTTDKYEKKQVFTVKLAGDTVHGKDWTIWHVLVQVVVPGNTSTMYFYLRQVELSNVNALLLWPYKTKVPILASSTAMTKKTRFVEVSPEAAVSIVLHAVKHFDLPVHGVLVGSFGNESVKVSRAIPVCHGAPTQPILETALALIKSNAEDAVVVGWYVSPRLEMDTRPGPAALKVVAGLASGDDKKEPALVVLLNNELDKALRESDRAVKESFKALGKDFGQQWLEPLEMQLKNEDSIKTAVKNALTNGITVTDLMDHFEGGQVFPDDSVKGLF